MNDLPAPPMGPLSKEPAPSCSILDTSDPGSLVNMLSGALKTALERVAKQHPDWIGVDERTLRSLTKLHPTPNESRIRMSFWNEYNRAIMSGKPMVITNIYAGIVSKECFYTYYLGKDALVAWMFCPPTNYTKLMEEALNAGLEQLRDILNEPHISSHKVNVKLAELKFKITQFLDARVKGSVIQKNVNVNVDVPAKHIQNETMEEIEKRIKDLERQERLERSTVETSARVVQEEEISKDLPEE